MTLIDVFPSSRIVERQLVRCSSNYWTVLVMVSFDGEWQLAVEHVLEIGQTERTPCRRAVEFGEWMKVEVVDDLVDEVLVVIRVVWSIIVIRFRYLQ